VTPAPRLAGAKGRLGFVTFELDKNVDGRWTLAITNGAAKPIVVSGTPGQLNELVGPIAHVIDLVRDPNEKVCAFCGNTSSEMFPVDAKFGAADCHAGCLTDHGRGQAEAHLERQEVAP
jgi:hypothetical protein